MDTLLAISQQEANEERFSRKNIDKAIREEIKANPLLALKVDQGVELLQDWLAKKHYQSKQDRLNQLRDIDLHKLVQEVLIGCAYFQRPDLFTSASSQLASRLGWSDKKAAITTMAEILAVLCITDAFDIYKEAKVTSLMLVSRMGLSDKLLNFIEHSEYLPPMVCEPIPLESNYDSGYLTHKESLILGRGNHHEGNICLDVLNLMNKVPLKLNTEFLSSFEEEPSYEIKTPEQQDEWNRFKEQSYYFYSLLVNQGNRFYLTHAVDKRGRVYARGYHITTQGTAFKKASIELADEELVEGVPT